MREILFRGKRKDKGEWIIGAYFLMQHNDSRQHHHHFIIPEGIDVSIGTPIEKIQVEIIPETVGQYTGLTDKNGKKIFEGDIVKGKNGLGYVNYNNGCFCIKGYKYKSYFNNPAIDVVMNEGFIKVIGNIYDNPELLEDKKTQEG